MTPLQTLSAITATREPQTGCQRLTDVHNIGLDSAKDAAEQVARWLRLLDIANSLTNAHLRRVALDMLRHQPAADVERFLWRLGK